MALKDPVARKAYQRDWYERNRERANAGVSRWRARHPEAARALEAQWRERHSEVKQAIAARWRLNHPEQVRALSRRARALRANAPCGEPFTIEDVIARCGWVCGICGLPIDPNAQDKTRRSLDHIVPISKGGAHTLENAQLAHQNCNSRKGNR